MYIDGWYNDIRKYKIVEIDILIMCKFAGKAREEIGMESCNMFI